MTTEHSFAVGIPFYNEEETLVANVKRLAAHCADLGEEFEFGVLLEAAAPKGGGFNPVPVGIPPAPDPYPKR